MGLKVLGPLELVVGNQPVRIGGPRERIVLAALALRPNRVTSVEHLIDAVWDCAPPPSARRQIHVCISGLRKLFGDAAAPGAIKTYPPGYLLDIAGKELDSAEFGRLVVTAREHAGRGRLAEAASDLRQALALWRGPALEDVRSELVQRGAALLAEERLTAIEERVRLDLELGLHEEICGELRALIGEHPLRERLYAFLMLALYRSGRQAEALEVCRQARSTLIEEVGIEPGQELQDLTAAILNRDTALDPHRAEAGAPEPQPVAEESVTPRQVPGSIADFVGRDHHVAAIKRTLFDENGAASPFAVRIVGICGRGGVGKSTLALRVAHELSDSFPDGHLYADLDGDCEDRTAQVLAQFLRALGVPGAGIPEDLQERAKLHRSRLAKLRLLVVLDDVTSEDQVLPLLPGGPTCPVLITSRVRLTGLSGVHWIDVDVFDIANSMELLSKIVGADRVRAERESAVELVKLCGGLPLALRIAGARLVSRPHWHIAGLVRRLANEASRLDEFSHRGLELRSSIALTYRGLPADAKRLFRLFALLRAPDFPAWTAAALLDTSQLEGEEVLACLVDAQLLDLVEYPGERVRHRFHDLIRLYATELLNDTESEAEKRAALSRVLGAWLALAERAHRKEYGGNYTVLHGTAPRWWRTEGDPETDPVDNPMDWWENERRALVAAVRQAAELGMDELCWDLALTSVSLFEVKGYFDDWQETAQLGHDATERAGNRIGQAAMLYSLGSLYVYQKRLTDADRCFAAALDMFAAAGITHGCALVLRNAASVDRMRGNFVAMLAKYDEALIKLRGVGDLIGEATILRRVATYHIDEGDLELARTLLDEALDMCRRATYLRGEAQVLNRFASLYLGSGQVAEARHALHQVLRIVRDIGDRIGEAHALYGLGLVRRQEGRLDNAETTLVNALSLAKRMGEPLIEGQAHYALGGIELARDNNSAAAVQLVRARDVFANLGATLWHAKTLILLSEVHDHGDPVLAAAELDRATGILREIDSKESNRLLAQLAEAETKQIGTDQEHRREE